MIKDRGWCDTVPFIEEDNAILGEDIKVSEVCVWTDMDAIKALTEDTLFNEETE